MDNFEILWKKKKADLAKKIIKSPNAQSAYSFAKELAEMELSESCKGVCEAGQNRDPLESADALFIELATAAEPMVEFLREKFNPHATAVITDGFVKIAADEVGIPLSEETECKRRNSR